MRLSKEAILLLSCYAFFHHVYVALPMKSYSLITPFLSSAKSARMICLNISFLVESLRIVFTSIVFPGSRTLSRYLQPLHRSRCLVVKPYFLPYLIVFLSLHLGKVIMGLGG